MTAGFGAAALTGSTLGDATMLELVLTVCLLADPTSCKSERVPVLEGIGLRRYMVEAQLLAAQWVNDHLGWTIGRWRCGPPEA